MPYIRDEKNPLKVTRTDYPDWYDFIEHMRMARSQFRALMEARQRRLESLRADPDGDPARIESTEAELSRYQTAVVIASELIFKLIAAPADTTLRRALSEYDLSQHEKAMLHMRYLYHWIDWRADFNWDSPLLRRGKEHVRNYIRSTYYEPSANSNTDR